VPDPLPRNDACIFCKIIAGQIPAHSVFDDEHVFAFLDIGPLSAGHTLVIPKGHYARLDETPDWLIGQCAQVIRRLSRVITGAVGANAWNVLQNNGPEAGQVVEHVHFHIIPRRENDGLGYRWNAGEIDHDQAKMLAEKIRAGINQ